MEQRKIQKLKKTHYIEFFRRSKLYRPFITVVVRTTTASYCVLCICLCLGCRLMQAISRRVFGKLYNHIFDMIRVGDLAENKAFFLAGGLYVHVAEVEYRRDNPFDGRGDILDARKIEFAYFTNEQAFLFDVDDTFIGNNPNIKIIIDPREEAEQPYEDEKSVFNKNKKARVFGSHHFWEKGRKKEEAYDEEK